jgi:hypothetical protein
MEMYADGRRKGGGESKAERCPTTSFGFVNQWSSLVSTSSSWKSGVGS